MYELSRKYGLTGTDAMVFEALVFLCKKTGSWKGSAQKLADFSCCGDKVTAWRIVKHLVSLGIVLQNETGALQIETKSLQYETNSKEERTKEENIKPKISNQSVLKMTDKVGRTDGLFSSDFNEFWAAYKPLPMYNNRKKKCYELFGTMPRDWQLLAVKKASQHLPDTNPFFWLQEETFLRDSVGVAAKTEPPQKPHWLSPPEQEDCLRGGVVVVVCKNPETGLFGAVTKEDAEKFKLNVLRTM